MTYALTTIDMGRAVLPTPPIVNEQFSRTFRLLAENQTLGILLRLPHGLGTLRSRTAGAQWAGRRLAAAPEPGRVLLTHGTQNALAIVLRGKVPAGGALAAERLTYTSLQPLARHLRIPIIGIEVDDLGLVPEAFEEACAAHRPAALYVNPTIHTPTATIMPVARRIEIAAIARKYRVAIIEDDVQSLLAVDLPPPLSSFAPEISWYVISFGKSLNLGLRNAYLVAPTADELERTIAPIRMLTSWGASAISAEIGTMWIEDGTVSRILSAVAADVAARHALAVVTLNEAEFAAHPAAHHLWLKLPPEWSSAAFARQAEQAGVVVWPAERFLAAPGPAANAVRLSLSNPLTIGDLQIGLSRMVALLKRGPR